MKRNDFITIGILAILAIFIWFHDTSWMSSAENTLPILISIPLFIWFGMPWRFREDPLPIPTRWIVLSTFLFLTGTALNMTLILTVGWVALLWGWLSQRIEPETRPNVLKLIILPLMAFPWITQDADRIGWWFRLTSAWSTAHLFSLIGFNVKQEGTYILIRNLPVSVEAACAGLNTLQSMFIAGSLLAYIQLKDTSRYWANILLLIGIAWFANTFRIIFLTITAFVVSPEFALASFHTWGGLLVLLLMFGMCWLVFSWQNEKE